VHVKLDHCSPTQKLYESLGVWLQVVLILRSDFGYCIFTSFVVSVHMFRDITLSPFTHRI